MTLDDQTIALEKDWHVTLVTPNRPERLNAISQPMPSEPRTVCDDAMAGAAIHAVVLTGAGKAYSSGVELQDQAAKPPWGHAEREPALRRIPDCGDAALDLSSNGTS